MLTELHIENLGVIERLDLALGVGMTAVTGETGAGKTMLVDALELLVGGRADATVVRPGATEARVDGRFVVADEELVLSRVVPAEGRSRAYIDGRPSTVGALADAAAGLVDLHGQHEHQSLLATATQRAALDLFGAVDVAPLGAARARLTVVDAELAALGGAARERAREIDLLRFQVAELDAAALDEPDEEQQLAAREELLADAAGHREAGRAVHDALADDGGARDAVAAALSTVAGRAPFRGSADRLAALLAELDDVIGELRDTTEGIDEDPEQLAAVRQRRQLLRDLGRKYGDDVGEMLRYRDDAGARLAELEGHDRRATVIDAERAAAADAERAAAATVGAARRAAGPALGAAVTERLRELALPHASITVELADATVDPAGEQVQFHFTANPGSPPQPLTKVASGGELARAMLALRLVLTGDDEPGRDGVRTLVFDEVDAGIGGTAATAVGRALAEVGRRHQVLVVTHLAQVAAQATTQVAVVKSVAGDVTTATAAVVAGDERVAELARMLSGEDGGDAARRHAVQLLGAGSAPAGRAVRPRRTTGG
jgi:DNA repair protein RecN (Recombination protein N)